MVAIIESAEDDLAGLCKVWSDESKSEDKLDFFLPEKVEYICLKAM